jgi:hypothetical protein
MSNAVDEGDEERFLLGCRVSYSRGCESVDGDFYFAWARHVDDVIGAFEV